MAGAGKKTFTAGETLTASDVNTYLMEQSVMVFGGTAARASAIPTPSTGMVSYVGDNGTETPSSTIPQIEAYTGASWQNLGGLTLLASYPYTAVSSIVMDNIFTTAYENYRLIITGTGSANVEWNFNFRTGGVANGFGFYGAGFYTAFNGVTANFKSANNTLVAPIISGGTGGVGAVIEAIHPRSGSSAIVQGQFHYQPGGYNAFAGYNAPSGNYDGFALTPTSGTTTGRIRVYGYRN